MQEPEEAMGGISQCRARETQILDFVGRPYEHFRMLAAYVSNLPSFFPYLCATIIEQNMS